MNPMTLPPQPGYASVESDRDPQTMSGPLPTKWDEARRFPRFYYQAMVEATIHPLNDNRGQPLVRCSMLTRDLSRGGLNLLHTEQLYPGQKIDVVLCESAPRSVEVIWCRRLADRRYTVGCRFVKAGEAPDEPTASASS